MAHKFLPKARQWLFCDHFQIQNPQLQVQPSKGHVAHWDSVASWEKNQSQRKKTDLQVDPILSGSVFCSNYNIWQIGKHGWSRKSSSFLITLSCVILEASAWVSMEWDVISSSGLAPTIPCPSFVGVIHQLLFSLHYREIWATLQDVIWVLWISAWMKYYVKLYTFHELGNSSEINPLYKLIGILPQTSKEAWGVWRQEQTESMECKQSKAKPYQFEGNDKAWTGCCLNFSSGIPPGEALPSLLGTGMKQSLNGCSLNPTIKECKLFYTSDMKVFPSWRIEPWHRRQMGIMWAWRNSLSSRSSCWILMDHADKMVFSMVLWLRAGLWKHEHQDLHSTGDCGVTKPHKRSKLCPLLQCWRVCWGVEGQCDPMSQPGWLWG